MSKGTKDIFYVTTKTGLKIQVKRPVRKPFLKKQQKVLKSDKIFNIEITGTYKWGDTVLIVEPPVFKIFYKDEVVSSFDIVKSPIKFIFNFSKYKGRMKREYIDFQVRNKLLTMLNNLIKDIHYKDSFHDVTYEESLTNIQKIKKIQECLEDLYNNFTIWKALENEKDFSKNLKELSYRYTRKTIAQQPNNNAKGIQK